MHLDSPPEAVMVGDRQRFVPQVRRLFDQFPCPRGTVEKGVVRVTMQLSVSTHHITLIEHMFDCDSKSPTARPLRLSEALASRGIRQTRLSDRPPPGRGHHPDRLRPKPGPLATLTRLARWKSTDRRRWSGSPAADDDGSLPTPEFDIALSAPTARDVTSWRNVGS